MATVTEREKKTEKYERQLSKVKVKDCLEKDSKFDNLITSAVIPATSTVTLNAVLKQARERDERADISPKI